MSFDFDAPETTQNEGGATNEPGTYHVVVTETKEGESSKGKPIDGVTVAVEILAGTVDGQQGKSHTESFFAPDLSQDESKQNNAKRKLAALFIAGGVMQPEQLGKPAKIEVGQMNGRQMVMKLERRMDKDEKTGKWNVPTNYVQVAYSDIFHVDDPEVSAVPKNAEALALIPADQRHKADWFAWKKSGKRTGASVVQSPSAAGSMESQAADLF
ncbi:DUF669 domain-containing protein [Crateriforma conspicua]|uniref:DUF669 domain-containing protein n=1 Tax=Crateriforma conspicua TaxID=2527996 RepID=A0A5C5XUF0_9PLAN|nr:DUF669 domain-containing protein [Crateriforma conspicua]TWT65645.1 hypothetical protein Pan14r_51920 [Crateriforma conspicua]